MDVVLYENERIDDLERNGYRIIQNKNKFCFGMDAVLLSGFVCDREGTFADRTMGSTLRSAAAKELTIADLGTGTGIIPILLRGKLGARGPKNCSQWIYGLEIQEEVKEMAERSVLLNDLEDDIKIVAGDIKNASEILGKNSFDVVTSNPPYKKSGVGLESPDMSKAISRNEVLCTFEDVAREAARLLKPGGRFYLVHRPERLAELMDTLREYKLEPKRLRMVHSYIDSDAVMVMVEAAKGGGQFMKVEKPLIIYKEKGVYTDEIINIYYY